MVLQRVLQAETSWTVLQFKEMASRCVPYVMSTFTSFSHCSRNYGEKMGKKECSATLRARDLLVVDFDDTCTVGDTISLVVSATMSDAGGDGLAERKRQLYKFLGEEYVTKKNALMDALLPPVEAVGTNTQSCTTNQEAWFEDFLHHLSAFDKERNNAVFQSTLLSGASIESLKLASSQVEFRPHCIDTLLSALDAGMEVAIVSVNWSSEFIRSAFAHDGRLSIHMYDDHGVDDKHRDRPSSVLLVANSLEFETERTTGLLRHRSCETALDKREILRRLNRFGRSTIYVGDSITDVGSLLEASLGIVMGDDAALKRVLHRVGVNLVPLDTYDAERSNQDRLLYYTDSWREIWELHKQKKDLS